MRAACLRAARPPRRSHGSVSAGRSWSKPVGHATGITVYNSLAGEKTPLVSLKPQYLTWYSCGPTVYDHAHLGHARTYVAFDIMQRILTDVFGVSVQHVMGMTDVDDKIVKRAAAESKPLIDVARRFEELFHADMADLGVRPPAAITRVSEHIPEIVKYCQKIIDNGFGYVANGSVYFDSEAFAERRRRGRALLVASSENAEVQQQVGQDEELLAEKRRPADFALWKAADSTQPSWSSPWGSGRPGWHIECSAMSSSIFGSLLDVHTGGIDLRFPHHENEVSQCLAHDSHTTQWPNYFLHAGHLYIAGAKMSKSLKNFISIRDYLANNTATLFRLFCLSVPYRTGVEYSEDRMKDAAALERKLREFLQNLRGVAKNSSAAIGSSSVKWRGEEEGRVQQVLMHTQANVRAALANDFDTPRALQELNQLLSAANVYMLQRSPSPYLLATIEAYTEWLLRSFGLASIASDTQPTARHGEQTQRSIEAFAAFRAAVRRAAVGAGNVPAELRLKAILRECDVVRDTTVPSLGYRLEDRADFAFLVKLRTAEEHHKHGNQV